MKAASRVTSPLIGGVMFVALWQLLAWLIQRPILPSPVVVVPLFIKSLPGELGLHLMASAGRVLAAIGAAVATAAPLGLILGQMPRLDRIFSPLVAVVYPIPKIVFLPVIYVLMGITDLSKIFQILVVVRDEAANLRPELILSVRSLCAGRRALFRYVYLPASLPAVLTALRVSVGFLITAILVVNNLRDIPTDSKTGKRTLAVTLGRQTTIAEFVLLLAAAYASLPVIWTVGGFSAGVLLPFFCLPAAVSLVGNVSTFTGAELNRCLGETAKLSLVFSVLLSTGLLI